MKNFNSIWHEPLTKEMVNHRNEGSLAAFLGIECINVSDSGLLFQMPIEVKHLQPMGIVHGGANCVLVETAASNGANFSIDQSRFRAVGIEINVNHIKKASTGILLASATPDHLGKSTHIWSVRISRNEELIAVGRMTILIL